MPVGDFFAVMLEKGLVQAVSGLPSVVYSMHNRESLKFGRLTFKGLKVLCFRFA
jgi:hypothetical protein